MKDVSFEIDEFSKGKLYSNTYAMGMQLYVLLLMKPGDHADDPDKGIDVLKYRIDCTDDIVTELQEKINNQVTEYCDFSINDMVIELKDEELYIGIQSPSFQEILIFNTENDDVLMTVANA